MDRGSELGLNLDFKLWVSAWTVCYFDLNSNPKRYIDRDFDLEQMYLTINLYLFRKLKVSVLFTCTVGNPVITNIVPDFSRDKETLQEGIFRDLQSYMSYSDKPWGRNCNFSSWKRHEFCQFPSMSLLHKLKHEFSDEKTWIFLSVLLRQKSSELKL